MMLKKLLAFSGLLATFAMPASAAILKFEFSGTSNGHFGPVEELSGHFLFDTSTPLSNLTLGSDGSVAFQLSGGMSDFHARLGNIWSADVDGPAGGGVNAYLDATDEVNFSAGPLDFFDLFPQGPGVNPNKEQWLSSADPLADFFLGNGAVMNGCCFGIGYPISEDYPRGFIYGSASVTVSAIPIPAAGWLFMSALMGLTGKKRLFRS